VTRVLVTGATGLIGSNISVAALREGYQVRALVRHESRADELQALGVEVFRGDIADRAAVLSAGAGCDYCIHSAALVVGGTAATKLLAYEDTMRRVRPPEPMPAHPSSPILAADTARSCVAALRRGIAGEVYLLIGRPEDFSTSVGAVNLALEIARRPYRVRALTRQELQTPEALARWGPSQVHAATQFADPPAWNALTIERLGHHPTPLRQAMEQTVAWMFDHELV
jgi:nucleoside-diphosphate-sugar epimerase